ncbi:ABC transporter substrate-binding protein [Acidovorax sp. LjRoot117]|uniref:ABC transporter substrate-binding protein n=1 Tax=Acidovorax sp. LjRoot117 TaxID=3342255 RepID=UPI003ED0E4A4
MKRRALLIRSACAAAVPAAFVPSLRAADIYARYRGQKVVLSLPKHHHYDAAIKLFPQFTQETGILVEFEQLPIAEMKKKQLVEMAKGQGGYDLISYVVMWKGEYVKKNFIREIEPFLKNPQLALGDFDLPDVIPSFLENIGLVGGWKGYLAGGAAKLYGLPYGAETSVLAYRSDIFDKLNLKAPTSYFELEQMLPVLHDKAGMGALASRGKEGHQCVHAWLLHLNPLNGGIFENSWLPRFNDAAGVRAAQLLKKIIDTGPAGALNFGQSEMINAFLQGESAMYLDSTLIFGAVRDPKLSKVNGKVAFARHPRGSRYASQTGGLGLAIPTNARNADSAFLLMQWLTAKNQDKAVCHLGGMPHRMSTLADESLGRKYPEFQMLSRSIGDANPNWRPIIAQWDEINTDVLGKSIHDVIAGRQPAEAALNDAAQAVKKIMQREGYIT